MLAVVLMPNNWGKIKGKISGAGKKLSLQKYFCLLRCGHIECSAKSCLVIPVLKYFNTDPALKGFIPYQPSCSPELLN